MWFAVQYTTEHFQQTSLLINKQAGNKQQKNDINKAHQQNRIFKHQ